MNCKICNKELNSHNTIGTCRKHRSLSSVKQAYMREYRIANKAILKEKKKAFRIANKDKINRDWQNRFKTDLNFKLAHNLRSRIGRFFKRESKNSSAVKDLGCTISELKEWLESKFDSNMNWDNWGINGWHIDHIIPLSSFNLLDPEQFKKAAHYTNLQPLWSKDNISKGGTNRIKYSQECSAIKND